MAEPLGKEECGCSSGKFVLSLNPVKMNHGRLAEVAVLTLSQSEQHKALLRRKKLTVKVNQNQVLKSGPVVCDTAGG